MPVTGVTLAQLTSALEGRFLGRDLASISVIGADHRGRIVVQVVLESRFLGDVPPPPATPPPRPQGAPAGSGEPAPESGAGDVPRAPPAVVLPRGRPSEVAELPADVRALAVRLAKNQPGGGERILRAARAGIGDRLVVNGGPISPEVVPALPYLPTSVYAVLRAKDGSGPWVCNRILAYGALCGNPLAPVSVSRGFPSESEAKAYFWGSGLALEMPPLWWIA